MHTYAIYFSKVGINFLVPRIIHADVRGVALRVAFLHHPIIIVAIHPGHAHGRVSGTGDDERADVVLGGVAGDLLAASYLAFVVDGIFPYFIDAVLVVGPVLGGDGEIEVVDMFGIHGHAAAVAALRGVPVLVEGVSGILHPRAAPLTARPSSIPINMCRLGIIDMRIGDNGILVLV